MTLQTGPVADRVFDAFARVTGMSRARLDAPGTTVVTTEDRAGSGAVAFYRLGDHAVVWADPALEPAVASFADGDRAAGRADIGAALESMGFSFVADADVRVLTDAGPTPAQPLPDGYDHRWLSAEIAADVDLVRAFADRSDPDDVEEAALDEMDDQYLEDAINVLTASGRPDQLVAYASACPWEWDADFGDIGVLIDPAHRGSGLGHFVVRHTVARLLESGQIPLYRHPRYIEGSMAIAVAAGFQPAATLAFFVRGDS